MFDQPWLFQIIENYPADWSMFFDRLIWQQMEAEWLTTPLLRLYTWRTPTISIGYHQKISDFDLTKIARNGISIVRRPTGGRAVFHSQDITYSVITPLVNNSPQQIYEWIHQALHKGLLNLDIDSQFEQNKFTKTIQGEIPKTCFSSSARWELKIASKKLVGSAQRVGQRAILQHGSIPITAEHQNIFTYLNEPPEKKIRLKLFYETHTASLNEASQKKFDPAHPSDLFNSLKNGFAEAFNIIDWQPVTTSWT